MTVQATPAQYNGLTELVPTLPSAWYTDAGHYERELKAFWYRGWVDVGRSSDVPGPLCYKTLAIGSQSIVLVRDEAGVLKGFHNTCRHRGSLLLTEPSGRLNARMISCPYHRWGYDLSGELVRVPSIACPSGFDRKDYPLYDIAVREWQGFVFVSLAGSDAPDFEAHFDRDSERVHNWPIADLVVGHSWQKVIACNWKVFWENFNECLHCPGVHPELCEMVPIYGRGLMSERDDPDWQQRGATDDPRYKGGLKPGAVTWTMDGQVHGRPFEGLTEAERRAGQTYVTSLPSMFVVTHLDYVRSVRLRPLGPEQTELTADWLFSRETLADPAFDLEKVVGFAKIVLDQDAAICEVNQAGLRSIRHQQGVLMPEEYVLARFHRYIRDGLGETA